LDKELHIITLDIPYPPDYGGMIDSFYRIRALYHLGVRIHLHCFEYGRLHSEELESLCKTVNYYPRNPGILPHLTLLPYTVKSRCSDSLLRNLLKDDFPIFFDGIHTTCFLRHPSLNSRKRFVRTHNIEHRYFSSLASYQKGPLNKICFEIESIRLKRYEKYLREADRLFTISPSDYEYFQNKYHTAELILPFHPYGKIESQKGTGDYCLFHSNLAVSENIAVAEFLIKKVFSRVPYSCVLAGKNPPQHLIKKSSHFSNIRIITNPDIKTMTELIRNAHINILPVYAINGLKLKLLMALCNGRHCIVNERMIRATWLEDLCHVADTAESMIEKINSLMKQPFTVETITAREKIIFRYYDNYINSKKLVSLIFT
jgi:hypothetical protein